MTEKDEKKRALDLALAQIEKQYGKGAVMKLGADDRPADVPAISSGSLGLDIALGVGGFPRGRCGSNVPRDEALDLRFAVAAPARWLQGDQQGSAPRLREAA